MQVLVADDDRLERTVLRAMVLRLGHTCLGAPDGYTALRLFCESEPDVVISDWLMPGLQGPELCLRVRAAAAGRPVYFILETVLADRDHVIRAGSVGVDAYMVKPVRLQELTVRLAAAELALVAQRAGAADRGARTASPQHALVWQAPDQLADIDVDQLADYRTADGGSSDLLLELVQIFREDTPAYLEQLRLAILHSDAKALREVAHTLKGSTSAIGAVQMRAICLDIERLADEGNIPHRRAQLEELKAAFGRSVAALQRLTAP